MLTGLPLIRMLDHVSVERRALQDVTAVDAENGVILALLRTRLIDDRADLGQADICRLCRKVIPTHDTAVHIRRREDRQITGKSRASRERRRQSSENHDFQRAFRFHNTIPFPIRYTINKYEYTRYPLIISAMSQHSRCPSG